MESVSPQRESLLMVMDFPVDGVCNIMFRKVTETKLPTLTYYSPQPQLKFRLRPNIAFGELKY